MLKEMLCILTFCLTTQILIAQNNQQDEQPSCIGRYSLNVSATADKYGSYTLRLFLLDTETGIVWLNTEPEHKGLWIQLPPLPNYCKSFPEVKKSSSRESLIEKSY